MKRIDLNHPNETVPCKERKMRFKLFILYILLSLAPVASASVQAAQPVYQDVGDPRLDAVVERALRRHNVPGASVAVVKNGALAWAKGYGLADTAQKLPVAPDTVFDAASVAKPVTAWGIMKLVEEGLLDLDAPVEQYMTRWHLPPSEYDHDQVTLRRILSHTAGLSTDGDTGVEPGEYVPTLEEALNGAVLGMRALHVATPPGEDYHYSSVGYTLLEIAIEEVTGEPFASYMQREVLDPLGMAHSSYDWTPELRAHAAVGHDWYNRPMPEYQYSTRAQGSLRTTAPDLALFMAASMPGPNGEPVGRGVLAPASVAEILTPVPFAREAESSHIIGLGYDLIRVDGRIVGARKTGDHRGYKPIVVMALETGEGIAIMANSDRAAIGFLMNIACAWSESVERDPLRADCRELMTIRNVQFIVAGVLALGALAYIAWVVSRIRAGRRRFGWALSWGKVVRIVLLLVVLAAWWVLWHTDTLLTRILGRLPDTAVTIRVLVPWPTAFVWVSWAVTLWLLALTAATFGTKVRERATV
jgi:CubicO group peptidase (beta-lactamase class C family)